MHKTNPLNNTHLQPEVDTYPIRRNLKQPGTSMLTQECDATVFGAYRGRGKMVAELYKKLYPLEYVVSLLKFIKEMASSSSGGRCSTRRMLYHVAWIFLLPQLSFTTIPQNSPLNPDEQLLQWFRLLLQHFSSGVGQNEHAVVICSSWSMSMSMFIVLRLKMERSIPAYKQGWSSFAQRFSPLQVANLYAFYRHYSNFRGYGNLIVPIEQWYDAAKEYPNDREAQEARFVAWYYGSNIPYSTTPPAPPVLNEDATYPPSFPYRDSTETTVSPETPREGTRKTSLEADSTYLINHSRRSRSTGRENPNLKEKTPRMGLMAVNTGHYRRTIDYQTD
ncbi:hypothetical protein EV360DRAFT_71109 [Lentinula raphanica]|nr:hypothetical protein EV360DRAFT_71109 [Lentinula raphanica]